MNCHSHADLGGQPGHGGVKPEPEGALWHAARGSAMPEYAQPLPRRVHWIAPAGTALPVCGFTVPLDHTT